MNNINMLIRGLLSSIQDEIHLWFLTFSWILMSNECLTHNVMTHISFLCKKSHFLKNISSLHIIWLITNKSFQICGIFHAFLPFSQRMQKKKNNFIWHLFLCTNLLNLMTKFQYCFVKSWIQSNWIRNV